MRDRLCILADTTRRRTHHDARPGAWLTTKDAAAMLAVTRQGVHWLVRDDQLRCEWTHSGQRVFRQTEVLRLVQARATARIQRRGDRLADVRLRMLKVDVEPRQLSLRLPGLRLVRARGQRREIA